MRALSLNESKESSSLEPSEGELPPSPSNSDKMSEAASTVGTHSRYPLMT